MLSFLFHDPILMLLDATSGRDFGQVSESAMGQALRLGSERWMVRLVGNQMGMADAAVIWREKFGR